MALVASLLLQHGALVADADSEGRTPFHVAAMACNLEVRDAGAGGRGWVDSNWLQYGKYCVRCSMPAKPKRLVSISDVIGSTTWAGYERDDACNHCSLQILGPAIVGMGGMFDATAVVCDKQWKAGVTPSGVSHR